MISLVCVDEKRVAVREPSHRGPLVRGAFKTVKHKRRTDIAFIYYQLYWVIDLNVVLIGRVPASLTLGVVSAILIQYSMHRPERPHTCILPAVLS
jgi:hypothetical protein